MGYQQKYYLVQGAFIEKPNIKYTGKKIADL
jgi:hypothetical protein